MRYRPDGLCASSSRRCACSCLCPLVSLTIALMLTFNSLFLLAADYLVLILRLSLPNCFIDVFCC
jgi:hypothetical protein